MKPILYLLTVALGIVLGHAMLLPAGMRIFAIRSRR